MQPGVWSLYLPVTNMAASVISNLRVYLITTDISLSHCADLASKFSPTWNFVKVHPTYSVLDTTGPDLIQTLVDCEPTFADHKMKNHL